MIMSPLSLSALIAMVLMTNGLWTDPDDLSLFIKKEYAAERFYKTYTDHHVYSYMDGEKIPLSNLPATKKTQHKIIFAKAKFDQLQIYGNGRVELTNKNTNPGFIPRLAPYDMSRSEIAAGHVWYSELTDARSLDRLQAEIKALIPTTDPHFKPNSVKVITWQVGNITAKYAECEPELIANNTQFCECLNYPSMMNHLSCEYLYSGFHKPMLNYSPSYCLTHETLDFRYCSCRRQGYLAFDTPKYCGCDARGKPKSVGFCAAIWYNIFYLQYNIPSYPPHIVDACELCECEDNLRKLNSNTLWAREVCQCKYFTYIKHLGMFRCFLYKLAGGDCSMYVLNNPEECRCMDELSADMTEAELMRCTLNRNNLDYVWLCEDPDTARDMVYCSCIADKTRDNREDEIYCRCAAISAQTDSDLCQCLNDWGYSGVCTRDVSAAAGIQSKHLHKRDADSENYDNIFQMLIVHNKRDTFVFYIYRKLQFIATYIETTLGTVNNSDLVFTGLRHPYTDDIYMVRFLMWHGNVDKNATWIYKVDDTVWSPEWTPQVYHGSF